MKLNYKKILAYAHNAGMAAGSAKVATPMTLVESDLFDNPIGKTYYVPEGPCGFAWVVTHEHGNGKFVKHLKAMAGLQVHGAKNVITGEDHEALHGNLDGKKCYYGGHYVTWVRMFGQSYEQKVAYAQAYADVLAGYGLKVYADERLD